MSRLSFKLLPLFIAVFALALPAEAREAFVIDNYDVEITVGTDRVHHVRESLDLTFTEPRHGIVRTIPLESSEENYLIKNFVVYNEPCSTDKSSDEFSAQIGTADRTVIGEKSYEIAYDLVFAADSHDEYDLVYVSPIGTDWDTQIGNASITVTLPTDEIYGVKATAGAYGSTDEIDDYSINDNTVTLSASSLEPYSGITLWIEVPEGTFADAPKSLTAVWDAASLALALFAVLAAAFAIFMWFTKGRDEKPIPVVEFYPPDGLSPAEMEYLMKRSVSNKATASMIFFWASKGFLKYKETKKGGFTLTKTAEMSDRPMYEKTCFDGLFTLGDGRTVTKRQIERGFYKHADSVAYGAAATFEGKRALDDAASVKRSTLLFLLNLLPCAVLTILGFIAAETPFALAGVITALAIYIVARGFFQKGRITAVKTVLYGILTAIFAFLLFLFALVFMLTLEPYFSAEACAVIDGAAIVGALFAAIAIKRSDYAVKLTGRCLGFADFLEKAEKERIEALVNENPDYYFDILPYAAVLGVTDVWTSKFADLIKEPPSWYGSDNGIDVFTLVMLNKSLNRSIRACRASYANMPSSSRTSGGSFSGGGGFSGGGAGGGGGHSW